MTLRLPLRSGAALLLGLLWAAPAAAASGEGGGLLWPTFNLLLLVAVIVYFARKPVQAWFATRRAQIEDDLEQAAALHKQGEERYAQWQRRLAELETELEAVRTRARERAEHEREQILADARAGAERIQRAATLAIEQELRRARDRLREEASDLAVELAGELLRERVDPDDRSRLLDEFIQRIESAPHDGAGGR